jgi:ABC-type transporter Mla maintaining outer membrane lipid asymmetry ATPase subunit MlaF
MNTSPSPADRPESARTGAEIRLERVSVAFGEHRIVSDINLHVAAGEFV